MTWFFGFIIFFVCAARILVEWADKRHRRDRKDL